MTGDQNRPMTDWTDKAITDAACRFSHVIQGGHITIALSDLRKLARIFAGQAPKPRVRLDQARFDLQAHLELTIELFCERLPPAIRDRIETGLMLPHLVEACRVGFETLTDEAESAVLHAEDVRAEIKTRAA